VETLQEEGGLADAANTRRFLGIIHKQTQRLEALVDDLLTLSAIESKEAKLQMAPQDIEPIIQSVVVMYKKAVDAAGQIMTAEVPPGLPKLYADRNRIEQVLINLLDNAVKFTPHKGEVYIKVKAEPPFMRLEVGDTGVGIPAEHLSRVFERFYRIDKARSVQLGGTGLGLAIVKHIVQAHQGKIEVHSTSGKGSVFTIFLPLNN
jgi:two-component system phosphate regulon sensor histidine kinase PhoR